jgi:alkanesulfonate monooxygenase SsuD/methylene tetrahydromethanopterin reductase-like flavin-dependent oxidoreductase (luciferase family)
MRAMRPGGPASARGPVYAAKEVLNNPPPVQAHVPILIGGSGERKTLATVARYADAWNTGGDLERVKHKDEVLRRWCDEVGRDEAEIERTLGGGCPVIRDSIEEAQKVAAAMAERNQGWQGPQDLLGPPELVVEHWLPYIELGFDHIYVDCPAPFDHETLERLAREVKPALERG